MIVNLKFTIKDMKKFNLIIALTFMMTSVLTHAAHLNGKLTFVANLSGQQSIPPLNTDAKGFVLLSYNSAMDSLILDASFTGLSGNVTGIHIHEGPLGVSGNVVTDLSSGVKINGFKTAITGSALASIKLDKLMNGGYYINVHTILNPNGEIRGQIGLEQDWKLTSWLNGNNEVPASGSAANGILSVKLSKDMKWVEVAAQMNGMSGAIMGAHLHKGAAGTNGGVVLDLSDSVKGNMIFGRFDATAIATDLINGNLYLNIHSAMYPNGEIRGQLALSKYLNFSVMLNGKQEVPAVNTNASGVANLMVNSTMDSLWIQLLANDLSGSIMGIHIHEGAAGTNGGVLTDLSDLVSGNMVSGVITGKTAVTAVLPKLLNGSAYINLHTAANANGEIRGQVMPLNRRVFQFNLDGKQQVPSVTTNANGKAYVSLAADISDLFVSFTGNNVNSKITAAHIHGAKAGMNGGVLTDVSAFVSQKNKDFSGSGTLKMGTDFNSDLITALVKYEAYLNFHTEDNPNGELRGQNEEPANSAFMTSAGKIELSNALVCFYPNPVTNNLTVSTADNESLSVTISDINGKVMLVEQTNFNKITLDVTALKTGIYIIDIATNNGVSRQKFTKTSN